MQSSQIKKQTFPNTAEQNVSELLLSVARNSLLEHLVEICEGAVIVDRRAQIVWMDERYTKRVGLEDPMMAIGQPVEKILPNSLMRKVVDTGRPILLDIMDFDEESFVVMRLPLKNQQGQVIGGIGLMLLDDVLSISPLVVRFNQLRQNFIEVPRSLTQVRRAKHTFNSIVGVSAVCETLKHQAQRAARTRAPVLITGETGTGKELLAQAMHNASQRADQPFVAVNIAAIPENLLEAELFGVLPGAYTGAGKGRQGKFKLADGGTLFLDEIGDMPVALQAKLLRVLQEGEFEALGSNHLVSVDVRIIAATSRNLQTEIEAHRFRSDLFYRLNVVTLTTPPLRERIADLPILCEHMLEQLCARLGLAPREISAEALQYLKNYTWPGNVRELQNVLERCLMMHDTPILMVNDIQAMLPMPHLHTLALPEKDGIRFSLEKALASTEKAMIVQALEACGRNKARAAVELGISRTSLYEKLARLGLS